MRLYLQNGTKAGKNETLATYLSLIAYKNQVNVFESEIEASQKGIESMIKPKTKESFIRSSISIIEEIESAG